MIGKIISYDPETQKGVVQVSRSIFEFHRDVWKEEFEPTVEDSVVVNQRRNKVMEVFLAGDYMPKGEAVKSRLTAGLLSIFLGGVGAGRFYLGFYKLGVMQLIVTVVTLGFGLLWGLIDGVLILTGNVIKDAQGRPLK